MSDGKQNSELISARLAPLFQWQSTSVFARLVTDLDESAEIDLLTDQRWKPLREALVLRDFAVTLGYDECKLEEDDFPDGRLRSKGSDLRVEITEVQTPGRRRHEEYRKFRENSANESLSHSDSDKLREAGSQWTDWVAAAVEKKLKNGKDTKFDILVYNNINDLFELPEISLASTKIGDLLAKVDYRDHWVWQVRSTTVDLLWPRVIRLRIPGLENRF